MTAHNLGIDSTAHELIDHCTGHEQHIDYQWIWHSWIVALLLGGFVTSA